jgi:hypothetical protein
MAVGGRPPRFDCLLGRADDLRAEVYLSFDGAAIEAVPGPISLSGTISGPECIRGTTLPVTARFVDLGPGPRPAARAILTEPSYWTPESPSLYRIEARLEEAATEVSYRGLVGLRRSGVRGRSFWLDGRRWVPRGIPCPDAVADLDAILGAGAVAVIEEPSDPICAAADLSGLVIAARVGLQSPYETAVARLEAWSRHPSVVLAILPAGREDLAAAVRNSKGTMLVGIEANGSTLRRKQAAEDRSGLDFIAVRLPPDAVPEVTWRDSDPGLPLVALRESASGPGVLPVQARKDCDRLQADLAAWNCDGRLSPPTWDWAGYLVVGGPIIQGRVQPT